MMAPTSYRSSLSRRCLILGVVLLLLPLPLIGQSAIVDRIIVSVNDDVVTLSDFYTTVSIFLQLNQVPSSVVSSSEGQRQIARRVLQELVNRTLLAQQAEQHELQVETAAVDDYVELISRQMGASVEQLRERLTEVGIVFDDFHDYIRLELTKLRVINVMVSSGISVSDAEVDAIMNERYPDTVTEVNFDVSQILMIPPRGAEDEVVAAVRDRLEEVRGRIQSGESFEELAQEFSQDSSRRNGGNMGQFERGQLPAAFEDHALNLLPGEISEVFQTRFGFHLVRLNDSWEEASIDVDSIREEIFREIQMSKQNSEVEQYMAQLHADSIVQILFDPSELY